MKYIREATLPVYILHHAVVLGIGWYVIHLEIGIGLKIAILLPLSVIITMTIYEGLIRRMRIPRLLMGMPPLPPVRHPAEQVNTAVQPAPKPSL